MVLLDVWMSDVVDVVSWSFWGVLMCHGVVRWMGE